MMLKICPLTIFELVFNFARRFHERLYRTRRTRQKKRRHNFHSGSSVDVFSYLQRLINTSFGRNFAQWVESRHQEPPHTYVSRNLATVVVRGILPWLRRRRTGLLPRGPKSSFQMRASFVFHLETKVLESGGRMEKLIAQVA